MSGWKESIEREWNRRHPAAGRTAGFPLIQSAFDEKEIIAMVDALLSGRITMGDRVRELEEQFAGAVGARHAVMVNSGSSANLLALAVAANPARLPHLEAGDEVIVPSVCWSTSVWPIVQMNLKPVFVDVDTDTLNVDLRDLERKITPRTKAMVAVHILGNCAPMDDLTRIVRRANLVLIEDTCESLGTRAAGRMLGSFGDFGTYSFYFSHHMTTGEGGMVVCTGAADYDLLKCLRAHGWTRELSNHEQVEAQHPEIDPRFCFVNLGYNLRPTEIQAAMGTCQLGRLEQMNQGRVKSYNRLKDALQTHPRWRKNFRFPVATPGTEPVWFGFPCLLDERFAGRLRAYLGYLSSKRIENRPIVSGNFTRQPAIRALGIETDPAQFPGAETIHRSGFFIGLPPAEPSFEAIDALADLMLGFEFSAGAE